MPYYGHLSQRQYIERMQESKDWFENDEAEALRRPMTDALKRFLERVLRQDMVIQLMARRYQRTPKRAGFRNGCYYRSLLTSFGLIPGLAVPRPRKGGLTNRVFRRYRRYWREVEQFIRDAFIAGASTRDTARLVEHLLGKSMSSSTVSELARLVDEQMRQFHKRTLDDNWRWLEMDAVWMKVGGYRATCKAMLVVYGVRPDGHREVIEFRQARSESRDEWAAFLWGLYHRGLKGERLELVTLDGGKGLWAAAADVYPEVARQLCWAHKLRNISDKLSVLHRKQCLASARTIYRAKDYRQAISRTRHWASQWREREPSAVRCLEADIDDLLVHMQVLKLEPQLWVRVRTTNAIERTFRELRRRTRSIGCFKNPASCDRMVYMLFKKLNQRWQTRPLYATSKSTQKD